jgi:predicted acyltransferase
MRSGGCRSGLADSLTPEGPGFEPEAAVAAAPAVLQTAISPAPTSTGSPSALVSAVPPPQIARRAAVLFVLGLAVYAFPHFDLGTQRILGVLQRIAICYAIAAAIYLTTGVRGQIIWIVSLLTAFWLIMNVPKLFKVEGRGSGTKNPT